MFTLPLLLLQVAVILAVARFVGWIFRKMHQPQVVGEMVAGILLGPSLLGLAAPGLFNFLFPPESLGFLNALSQIGLVLFMFLVGLELDAKVLKNQGRVAVFTSHVSIVFPFTLGTLLALYLYPRLSNNSVTFVQFALFIGTAMSITAFPVLARILTERKLLKTTLGAVTIACAAIDDVTGWIILAIVVLLIAPAEGSSPQ
jgi:Kef-type K+ transport system membrane component KefB